MVMADPSDLGHGKKKGEPSLEGVESETTDNDKTATINSNNVKPKKKVNTDICPKCTKTAARRASNKEGSIRCKICTFWWHPTCGGLGDQEYKLYAELSELGNPDLWQCATCKVGMGDLGLRWEQTGRIVAENTARIEKIETRLEKIEAKEDKLENELMTTKQELKDLKNSLTILKEDAMKKSIAEISERENNRSNLIIHGVSKSASMEPSERQAHDIKMLQNILNELGLSNYFRDELREDVRFLRRIGEKKEQQEVRPLKVGFVYLSQKERLIESARYLNQIPDLQHVSIGNDLTDMQRKEETCLWRKAGENNLAPTNEMKEKGLVMKVVGPRGNRRIILAPLRRTEEVDEEGRVRLIFRRRRREGEKDKVQGHNRWGGHGASISGANMEPLGHKEQGNWQGTVGGRSRREEQERTSGASGLEQLCQEGYKSPEQRSWSSGSGGEEKEKGRKERAQDRVQVSNPGVRALTGREEGQRVGLQGLGYPEEGFRSGAPWGQMKLDRNIRTGKGGRRYRMRVRSSTELAAFDSHWGRRYRRGPRLWDSAEHLTL